MSVMHWSLAEIAQTLDVAGFEHMSVGIHRVLTDSRAVSVGDVFVALPGARVDGHDFLDAVTQKGAVAAIVTRRVAGVSIPQLVVADAVLSLQMLAYAWRKKHIWSPCILVTGSNGKTSVKEMLASVLRIHFGQNSVLATQGNLNNHLGLPMTLLSGCSEHRAAVIEVGANHLGEIEQLAPLAEADTAMITSIGLAHVGEFGSLEAIVTAKGEIFKRLRAGSVAVVPIVPVGAAEDGWTTWQPLLASQRVIAAGMLSDVQVSRGWSAWVGVASRTVLASGQRIYLSTSDWGDAALDLPIMGEHHARNVALVCAALLMNGIAWLDIQQGLQRLQAPKGRLQSVALTPQVTIIDDSYNANPSSMIAAIHTLKEQPAERRMLVLGDMGELGTEAEVLHQQVGEVAKATGIDCVLALGQYASNTIAGVGRNGIVCNSIDDICTVIMKQLSYQQMTCILVKGSRSSRMERVIEALQKQMLVTAQKS